MACNEFSLSIVGVNLPAFAAVVISVPLLPDFPTERMQLCFKLSFDGGHLTSTC